MSAIRATCRSRGSKRTALDPRGVTTQRAGRLSFESVCVRLGYTVERREHSATFTASVAILTAQADFATAQAVDVTVNHAKHSDSIHATDNWMPARVSLDLCQRDTRTFMQGGRRYLQLNS